MTGVAAPAATLPDGLVARRRALAAQPGPLWVDSEMVVTYIEALRSRGLTMREIARLARRTPGQLRNLCRQQRTSRMIAISVWAIPLPEKGFTAPTERVPGVFAQRVVRSWRLDGWTWRSISAETGVSVPVLRRLARDGGRVEWQIERKIAVSMRTLRQRDPAVECRDGAWMAARSEAIRAGWCPLWQYADPRDPACEPVVTSQHERMGVVAQRVAGMAADGASRAEIVDALGVSWETIRTYHYRTGRRMPEVKR